MRALIACAFVVVAAFGTGATAAGAVGHVHRCSVYEIGGVAMVTFTNWVAPVLPGGAHGEPPFDWLYEAAQLTVQNVGDRDPNDWSVTPQRPRRKLVVACHFHFLSHGATVTVTVRSIVARDPLCSTVMSQAFWGMMR
jgi:hypothetical protein